MSGSFSSNYLNALAHPDLVDPAAAIEAGNKAAASIWANRESQAKQAAGQAYQGAVDPQTGEFDPNEMRRRLAASPAAALQAGTALQNTQSITSNQLDMAIKKANWVNSAAGAVLQSGDFSDAAMLRLFQQGAANGMLTFPEIQKQMALLPPDAAGRAQWLQEHQMTHASVQEQLNQRLGTQQTIATPGATSVVNVPPIRPNTVGTTPVTVQHGPAPGTTTETTVPVDKDGAIIPLDASGRPTRPPVGYRPIQQPVTAVPGVPPGGPPQFARPGGGGAGGGGPTAQPPIPPPAGARLVNGRFQPPQAQPQTPPAAPGGTPPQQPVTPPAPPPAPPAATPTPAAQPPVFRAPPQGQPEQQESNVKAYTADQANYPAVMTRAQNMAHAYDAFQQLKAATGKGAQGINDLRSWAQTLGIAPQGAVTQQALMEVINKYTERAMLDAAGGTGTDLARTMQSQANPNTGLSTPANIELLKNDMGKTLQQMAAFKEHGDASGAGYLKTRQQVSDQTDPRGFVWSLYSPEEQAKINAEVARDKTGAAADKLHKAIGMSARLGLTIPGAAPPPAAAPPAPNRQSMLMPPAAPQNALAMAG